MQNDEARRLNRHNIAAVGIVALVSLGSIAVINGMSEQAQRHAAERAAQATAQMAQVILAELDAMIDIPAGPFQMGCGADNISCQSDETPLRTVTLDAFQIDKYEVTNGQYRKCVSAGKCAPPRSNGSNTRDRYYGDAQYAAYPVIYIDWEQARAYCAWAGKRLPTAAEWEKAARGTDARIYPWGNQAPDCRRANFEDCDGDTAQVGSRQKGASPYGVMDMAGNAWEWVADWYGASYHASSPAENPGGPPSGEYHVLRGGSWYYDSWFLRASHRGWNPSGLTYVARGFRCAR
jgi:formylglycine-generating enzyme required for sulfatase activity